MNLDSQYGVCFRSCLSHLLDFMASRDHRDRLNIVMEGGHKNLGDCERIFNDLKGRYRRQGVDIFGTFSVGAKDSCAPLMLADFLAAFYSMLRAQNPEGIAAYAGQTPEPPKGEASLTFLELRPDALRNLKTGFERMRELEAEAWLGRRAARAVKMQMPA
ncbi:MAG: hypothetical protein E7812_00335 [Phenylobacterium sp.]|nr:MAG: hypothetical protein E7812_00335 [Phenylobacterium sp.]